ncbi:MAG TPA: SAM-dependent methyltransferase [Thermoanaerobaculia bacterium]|nr:SAM-dependent methyltransferase [Thermoanaerobaculia bacterium]
MSSLTERLRERIEREGPVSFADFMRAALYDPEDGYYARRSAIGDGGDFVTSPTVSPAFAGAVARMFAVDAAAWEDEVELVEVASGSGRFLEDFAGWIERLDPELRDRLRLTAVEAAAPRREELAARSISPAPRVLASANELTERSVRGWIFSNELYDALPTFRVVGSESGPRELRVGVGDRRFVWVEAAASPELARYLAEAGVTLAPGQKGEVCLEAPALHRRLARSLDSGRLVAFDYGHPARILYHPFARPEGTLAVHSLGRRGGDPLDEPGEVDLTAHVNWDALMAAGEAEGLHTDRIQRQGMVLSEAGVFDFARNEAEKWRIFRLVDPAGMGEEISALFQSRGMAQGATAL